MKKILWLLFIFPLSIYAQRENFEFIDQQVDLITQDDFSLLKDLTIELTKPARNEKEKVRAVFSWLAKNMKYDHQGLNKGWWDQYGMDENTAAATFAYKKGICRGFAVLMKMMLDEIKVENQYVFGNVHSDEFQRDTLRSNHVWNAVKLNDQWHLLDVTWALTDWKKGKPVDSYFFLADPREFTLTHYPDSAKWLLHENPMSYEAYRQLPKAGGNYFRLGFGPTIPRVEQHQNKVIFTVQIPPDFTVAMVKRNIKTYEEEGYKNFKVSKTGELTRIEITCDALEDIEFELTVVRDTPPIERYFGILTSIARKK